MSGVAKTPDEWLLDVAAGGGSSRPSDSHRLLETAYRHGLIGLLADPASPAYWEAATPVYTRLAARQQVMLGHLQRLSIAFRNAGVRAAVLKGPWLGERIYAVGRQRTFSDLDILVPRESLTTAIEVLRDYPEVESIPRQKPEADKREIPIHDPTGVTFAVDLHWDLFSYRQLLGRARVATDEAWVLAQFDPNPTLGQLWELPAPAIWVFLAAHATLDHRFRLILFRDFVELINRAPDWGAITEFAGRHALRSTTYLALWLARKWLKAEVPADVLSELRPPSAMMRATELLARRVHPVTFDGHRVHPLNLATVLLHDDRKERLKLAARAPLAVPGWRRKIRSRPTPPARSRTAIVVVSSTRRRGAEVFGEQLVAGLNRSGWSSDLVALTRTPEGPEVAAISLREAGDRAARLDWRILMRLRRLILVSRPDVILANGSATLKYTALALLWLRGRPSFLYGSVGEPRYWTRGLIRRWVQRLLLSRTDLILAVSKTTAQQLVEDLRQPESRVMVAETGVSPALVRIESGASAESVNVLVLGSLSHEKDPLAAVAAFARSLGDGRGMLRFVGAGPLHDQLVDASRAAGIGGSVEFTGAIPDVTEMLAWADVLLLTSRTEGLPGAVLEAGAAGVPAVGFDVGGVAEAIIDGETGFVVPAGDITAAAVALGKLADDRDLRRRLGEGARRYVQQRFLLPDAIDRYRRAIETAVRTAKS